MTIVLNERKYAEQILEDMDVSTGLRSKLTVIAKYYFANGLSKEKVSNNITEFVRACGIPPERWDMITMVQRVVSSAKKKKLIEIESIPITIEEVSAIEALNGRTTQRTAFTLLCLAKYLDIVNEKNDHWVWTPETQVMKMANVAATVMRRCEILNAIRDAGMTEYSKRVDNNSIHVLFIGGTEVAMNITDFRNLGYQWNMYHGEPYYVCGDCGLTGKMNEPSKVGDSRGRKREYCDSCIVKRRVQQKVNSAMRRRDISENK